MVDDKDKQEKENKEGQKPQEEEIQKELEEIMSQLSEKSGEETSSEEKKKKEELPRVSPEAPEEATQETKDIGALLDKFTTEQEEPEEELNALQRVVGVFWQPSKVFQYLRARPEFIVPLVLTILVSIFASYMVYDIALDDRIAIIEQNEKIPDEQKDRILDGIEASRSGTQRILFTFVVPPISVVVRFLLATLGFWFVGNVILGGKAKFKQLFSVYAYSYLIYTIVGTAVKLPLWLSKHTLQVHTSLAAFMPSEASQTVLFRFLDAFDIFTIWFLIVFGIGFAIVYRFSQTKGLVSVFATWLVWILITKVALGSIFAKFGG